MLHSRVTLYLSFCSDPPAGRLLSQADFMPEGLSGSGYIDLHLVRLYCSYHLTIPTEDPPECGAGL